MRVAAHAAARRYGVLVKVGQAGWKTVAQEHQRDGDSHGWALAYWASFLLAVRDPAGPLALGVHPFHRGTTGHVEPWLHPVLFLDVGAPRETRDLLEAYRVPEHFTYRRFFDRGVALYNPSDLVDLDVPLGGAYVDPWDARCGAADRLTLGPGQEKRAKFPTSKAPLSAVFHSFWLIFGRTIISRNGLEA